MPTYSTEADLMAVLISTQGDTVQAAEVILDLCEALSRLQYEKDVAEHVAHLAAQAAAEAMSTNAVKYE